MDVDRPAEDTYGRITNPERFQPVVAAARAMVDRLVRDYDVTRTTGDSAADLPQWRGAPLDTVRLAPREGVPLVVAVTDFPGAVIRFGEWTMRAFPGCGCDACDERPAEVMARMSDLAAAAVAGDYTEELTKRELRYATRGERGRYRLRRGEWRRHGAPGRHRWPPWPARA